MPVEEIHVPRLTAQHLTYGPRFDVDLLGARESTLFIARFGHLCLTAQDAYLGFSDPNSDLFVILTFPVRLS